MIDLTVKTLDSRNHSFSLEDDITVRGFKEQIAESVAVPADSQRLIYCGRVLQDEKKLIEYDVNGKVIHLVQRAPPQSGQRGNTSGQGQDQSQGQGQSQGPGGNSHRPHFRHARAQVHLPRIDGNAMYLGAMSFPADAEAQGASRPQLCNRQASMRLDIANKMLRRTNRVIHLMDNPTESSQSDSNENASSSTCQAQPQDPNHDQDQDQDQGQRQGQDQDLDQDQDQEQLQDDGTYEVEGGARGGEGLAQAASAAINAALSAAGLNNIAALSTAALSHLTLLGSQSDGTNPTVIHARIQRDNVDGGESATASNPNDINQSEQPQPAEQQQETPSQHQGADVQPQQQERQEQQEQQQSQQEQQNTSENANGRLYGRLRYPYQIDEPRRPLARLGHLIGYTRSTHERLMPYLIRCRDILMRDRVFPAGGGPDGVEEAQRVVNGVSEALHNLAHAAHALSDIIVDLNQEPPRDIHCRPYRVEHSRLLQAGIPIQVEAHISVQGRNQNINNNNESGSNAAPATTGAASTATESGGNADAANGAQNTNNAQQRSDTATQQQQPQQPQQQQQQQQQQQPNFGTLFNVPHNVEVLMEVGSDLGGNEQAQQNFSNRNNNNNGNPGRISAGIFPWGASPPPDFMHNLMQMIAGQVVRSVATVTSPNATASPAGEQQSTNNDETAPGPTTTVEGSTSNAGQSTQARGNTGTHPTTSTQTRSTPRPHVFRSTAHSLGLDLEQRLAFDPFLSCHSHHLSRNRPATSSPMTATGQQQQQANETPAPASENQTATSTTPLNTSAPTTENNASTENATPAPPTPATNVPIVNLLTQILSGAGTQIDRIQTGPGGWMHVFTSGVPVVQNLPANGSSQSGSGMTLIDLLGNAPGLGLSTNMGIIGPLRMDQTVQGEDLLFDLLVTVVQNITLEGWEALRGGHWEPLAGIRRPLREFFQNSFESTSLSGSEERIVDRLITELQPTLNQLLVEDTNARDGPEMGVDIPATIENLLRRHFLNILRLLFDNDVDDNRFAQGLLASMKTLQTEACSVLQYSFRGRQFRTENVAQRIVTRLTEGVGPPLRQWIVNSCVSHVYTYLAHMTQLPDDEVVPLLVLKTTSRPAPAAATPPVQQRVVQQTPPEPEPMETDAAEARVDTVEPSLDAEEGATFPGHEAVPADWVPIIARDEVRQRRQLQVQMQSQGMAGSGVGGFSDAYLGGMPSKRRKLIEQQKPRILLSPTPNHSSISISIDRLVRDSVGRAGIEEVEGAAAAVAADAGVRRAFGQAIRGCLYQHPQRQTTPDFPDPLRFPNATQYFAKRDETSEK